MSAGAKPGWATGQRKEQRIAACKPVTVSGKDVFGNSFSLNTFTVEIAACGARLRGLPPLALDTTLLLECGGERARYRVVWVAEKDSKHEGHVGLECIDIDKSIFGIKLPLPGLFYDEFKRVEAELIRSEDRYKRLFENSLGLICTHDLDGFLLSMNPAAAGTLGYKQDSGYGKNLAEVLAPSVRRYFPDYLKRMRERGQDSGYMLVVAHDKTKHVWLYRNLLVHESGSDPYVIGHAMDVTEQKRVEYELQDALAEVKTLRGLLAICAWCKRIRCEDGQWSELESYLSKHSDATFSHGICPECRKGFNPPAAE